MAKIPGEKLKMIIERHATLERELATAAGSGDAFVRLSKEYAELTPVAEGAIELRKLQMEVLGLEEMLQDPDTDDEMKALAEQELAEHRERLPELGEHMQVLLLPQDAADQKNAILEIRAGTGGDEAALFAADLYRMYQRYAELRGWKVEALQVSETDLNGVKEAQVLISGVDVFARLKFESGVHRVQRVPETESSGRIHTSAATVAVLPEAEEVDVKIEDKDLRIDVFRSSGPGGQSVNTTDSAVRITHIPTGIVVSQQDEKSQIRNKEKGLKILRARIYEFERRKRDEARSKDRKSKIGTGDRSERIRTYNWPQNRVTDHRINLTINKLTEFMEGEIYDEMIENLSLQAQEEELKNIN